MNKLDILKIFYRIKDLGYRFVIKCIVAKHRT
jgi:hypothetical protein